MAPERLHTLLSSFLTTLGAVAGNKKIVAAWLILLSLATAQVGEKVFIDRTRELAIVETNMQNIQKTLDKMDSTLEKNAEKLDNLLRETYRISAELEAHEKSNQKKK